MTEREENFQMIDKLERWRPLGILQLDQILNTTMKAKITTCTDYIRRVKKLCKSKLNEGNLIMV